MDLLVEKIFRRAWMQVDSQRERPDCTMPIDNSFRSCEHANHGVWIARQNAFWFGIHRDPRRTQRDIIGDQKVSDDVEKWFHVCGKIVEKMLH
jgi:hypothetical protein